MDESKNINLNSRERLILQAVIEDYIDSGYPIGSVSLKSHHRITCSPATIRQTMANLEQMGLLAHPFTSSGRIPTDLGYRYYVDVLISETKEQDFGINALLDDAQFLSSNIDDIMQATAYLLAKISSLFGIVILSEIGKSKLIDIELTQIASDRVMMILAMKSGLVKSIVLNLKISLRLSRINIIASVLKEKLTGLTLKEIKNSIQSRLKETEIYDHEIIQVLLQDVDDHFSVPGDAIVYKSSIQPLLNNPEFQEIDIIHKTMGALESDYIKNILIKQSDYDESYTIIGNENNGELLNHCTLSAAPFKHENIIGQLAIIGPTRIPYKIINNLLERCVEKIRNVY